jgi:hypothetical protein
MSAFIKTLGHKLDVPSVYFLYRVHSVDIYLYVSDILHSVHLSAVHTLILIVNVNTQDYYGSLTPHFVLDCS